LPSLGFNARVGRGVTNVRAVTLLLRPAVLDVGATRRCARCRRYAPLCSMSALRAEASLAVGVAAQGPQEGGLAEAGPVAIAEVELGVRALPEQEAGEALLATGPDDQVRIRLALRVEVLGDVVDVEHLGQFLDRAAGLRVLVEQGSNRVGD